MNKLFTLLIVIILAGLATFAGFVLAGGIYTLVYPSTAIGQTVQATSYLENVEWTNGTSINWGAVESNEIIVDDLSVQNTGQLNVNVSMLTTSLPSGWTQIWTANNTIIGPNSWANGTLTLTTGTVAATTYNWNTLVIAEQT